MAAMNNVSKLYSEEMDSYDSSSNQRGVDIRSKAFKGILNNQTKTVFDVRDSQQTNITGSQTIVKNYYHGPQTYKDLVDEMKINLANLYQLERNPLLSKDDLGFRLKSNETGQDTPLNEMLSPDPNYTKAPNRFLISGQSGVGKTTFCQKLAYDWALGKRDNAAEEFDLLLLKVFGKPEDDDLETSFKQLCQAESEGETIDEALRHKDTKILLVLDDYDKASDVVKDEIRFLVQYPLRFQSVFKLSSIILTTNEGYLSQHDKFFQCFKRRYELSRGKPTSTVLPTRQWQAPIKPHNSLVEQQQLNTVDKPSSMQLANMLKTRNQTTTQAHVRNFFSEFEEQ